MPLIFFHQFRSCSHRMRFIYSWEHWATSFHSQDTFTLWEVVLLSTCPTNRSSSFRSALRQALLINTATSNKDISVPLTVNLRDGSSFTLLFLSLYLNDNMMTLTTVSFWLAQWLTLLFVVYSLTQKCCNQSPEELFLRTGQPFIWCTSWPPFAESTVQLPS